jgi:hypothetical protein
MTHITETGMYAGSPICGCNKEERATAGDNFSHLPYRQIDAFMAGEDICPACKEEFEAAMAEEE